MEEGLSETLVYTVTGDPEAMRDFNRAHVRHQWKAWVKYAARTGVSSALAAGVAILVLRIFDPSIKPGVSWVVALAVAFLVGSLNVYSYAEKSIFSSAKAQEGEVWACEMDHERWTFTRHDGARTSIPWEIMALKFDHPECWYVEYGNRSVAVMRKPLREANLEEEFRRRAKFGDPANPPHSGL